MKPVAPTATNVGKSIPHESAVGHVTGSAWYIEDYPTIEGELWVDFAGTPIAAGRIRSIDTNAAASVDGVELVLTHQDITGVNRFGPIVHDEVFLVDDEISYLGQPVAVIAAKTRDAARTAAGLVKIEVEPGEPILTIDDAIAANSFLGPSRRIERGDIDRQFAAARHVIEGTFRSGGQEQFYLESQACQAIPGEGGQLKLISSTQNPTETQAVVAEVLGLGMHEIVCECKRMGGGFGGKETQSAIPAMMVGLVAGKTGRAARIVLRKSTDMLTTGKRHAYRSDYRVGFDDEGRILAAAFSFHSDGGAFTDLSPSVLGRSIMHADNAYFLPAVRIQGQVCKTNFPPNTAFRGFGGPQGVVVIENAIEEIAAKLGLDSLDVRRRNLYQDGNPHRSETPYGQPVKDHVLAEIFDSLEATSQYRRRVASVAAFNANHPTQRKGIALSAIKFGISFTSKFLNQANALVNVYTDGTIQVSTGGTEMGQGLNTKIRQIVADEFGIDWSKVRMMTTSTEKNNNTSPTAASASTDLNGNAAVIACERIRDRLKRFAAGRFAERPGCTVTPDDIQFARGRVFSRRHPEVAMEFAECCDLARRDRVDLGERAFYATPGIDFDGEAGRGSPFYYFTTGAAVAEVTIDRFTGDLVVDRVDLLMDVGSMINPGIDKGQVIGGFVQGMGWCTAEELVYDDRGELLATGPTTYKIPAISDLPKDFRYDFINNPRHQINVRRSKAVGEPPLMLGIAVWLAVKRALSFDRGGEQFDLKLPATGEEILMNLR